MPEYIEVNGQDIERYTYILTEQDKEAGEQEPKCSIDVQGEAIWTGKTKALIIIMPHYKNDIPQVINVGLEQSEIGQAIDIAEGAFHDDTYKKDIARLEQEVYRLEKQLEKAQEESMYGNS